MRAMYQRKQLHTFSLISNLIGYLKRHCLQSARSHAFNLGGGYKPYLHWVLPMSGFNNVLSILVYRTRSLFEPDFVMPEENNSRSHFLPLSEGEYRIVQNFFFPGRGRCHEVTDGVSQPASISYKCGVRVQPVGNRNLGLPTQQSCHTAWGKCKDAQSQELVADTHKRCNELHPTKLLTSLGRRSQLCEQSELQMREVVEQDWFNPHQDIQALINSCRISILSRLRGENPIFPEWGRSGWGDTKYGVCIPTTPLVEKGRCKKCLA